MRRYHTIERSKLSIEIADLHKEISKLVTPPSYIENDRPDGTGNDYAAAHYMRYILKKYFPTSGWVATDEPVMNDGKLVAWKTTGVLTWDYLVLGHPELKSSGSMAAAHKVQYSTKNPNNLSDLGNDIKASNTDTWKKALNFHLGICDDVYRWEYPELTKAQESKIITLANAVGDDFSKTLIRHIELKNNQVNKANYEKMIGSLKVKLKLKEQSNSPK